MSVEAIVARVYERYRAVYGDNLQGCCMLLVDEILDATGRGEPVAGELTWYGGSCRRTHWWAEVDGETIDPFGDYLLSFEEAPGRVEHHRDRGQFDRLLPRYERWRP